MLNSKWKSIWLALIGLAFFVSCSPAPEVDPTQPQEVLLQGKTMGTTYSVKLYVAPDSLRGLDLYRDVDAVLESVNQAMSTYREDSELSQLNRAPANVPFTLSSDTYKVLAESIRIGEQSGGVLDITVGPLVNLWGFGPDKRVTHTPSEEALTNARNHVGLDKLQLGQQQVTKLAEGMYIDLSTTAKGYGVDKVADYLEAHGIRDYMVEVGGEMRISGSKLAGQPWRIAVEKPVVEERAVQIILNPGTNAVATSGDYRNYFEENGQRYSHLIDPTTGKPIQHRLVSATVIHPACVTADGLATTLNVMGPEKAKAFAEQHKLAVYLIEKTDAGFEAWASPAFLPYIAHQ